MENRCSWCHAEICRLLGHLLSLFLPSPQGSKCLSHFFPSLFLAGHHLVLYSTVSPCGDRAQLCSAVIVLSCLERLCPARGTPVLSSQGPSWSPCCQNPDTRIKYNNFHRVLVHDWELRGVNLVCWRESDQLPPQTVLRHVTGGMCTLIRKRFKQPILTLLAIYFHGWPSAGLPYHQAGIFTEASQGQARKLSTPSAKWQITWSSRFRVKSHFSCHHIPWLLRSVFNLKYLFSNHKPSYLKRRKSQQITISNWEIF